MRIVVIGGSGHIGTHLVPRLVRAGHEVVSISRGERSAYADSPEWTSVRQVALDREREDAAGTFGDRVADLRPDVVVDLICFTPASATALVERLRGEVGHLLHCGSIWRFGLSNTVPITETTGTPPFGEYGVHKQAIAEMLRAETASGGLTTTSLHPGHIVGPGWAPIGPLGNLDPSVWQTISAGKTIGVPGLGAEMMHHVHADDVAQAFELAVAQPERAAGEDFSVVSPAAITVRGYVEAASGWFGHPGEVETLSWEQFRVGTPAEHADASWEHLVRSHSCSIDKAKELLGYAPRYGSMDAVLESVRWLIEHDQLEVARPLAVEPG